MHDIVDDVERSLLQRLGLAQALLIRILIIRVFVNVKETVFRA